MEWNTTLGMFEHHVKNTVYWVQQLALVIVVALSDQSQ
jgi:hypothetical protein